MKRTMVRIYSVCLRLVGIALVLVSGLASSAAAAVPTTITVSETMPPSTAPAVIVTSLVGSSGPDLDYIELYNQGDNPINLAGWTVQIHDTDVITPGCGTVNTTVTLPSQWLLNRRYVTLQRSSASVTSSTAIPFAPDDTALAGCSTPQFSGLNILDNTGAIEQSVVPFSNATPSTNEWATQTTPVIVVQHKQRGNSPNSTRAISGIFDTDYKFTSGSISLNSDPLYTPPTDIAGLQILEILPNSQACAPTSTNLTCNDYVKLYNPTDLPINLAGYRLRVGSKGQSESVANTFTWNDVLDPSSDELLMQPHQYFMLTLRNDKAPLSITDTGNFVWLEDAYGTTTYEPIVQYPDASSATKVGWAWAFDGTGWRWTSAPQPNAANYFPPAIPASSATSISISTNPTLKPCADNQFRNPATNRCNLIVDVSSLLSPCGEGQERNPDTNRCRAIVAASTQLASCQPGWERNPNTNRCRKLPEVAGAATTAAIKDIAAPAVDHTGWAVAVLVIALATAYGLYEWRQELRALAARSRASVHQLRSRHPFSRKP